MIIFEYEDFKIHMDENRIFWAETNPVISETKFKEILKFINYLNQPERSKREDILEIEAPEIPQYLLQSYEENCKFMEQFSGVNDDLKNDAVL